MSLAYGYTEEPKVELLNGEIVAMARPNVNHEMVMDNIKDLFKAHFRQRGGSCRIFAEVDVLLDDENHPVPDLSVVCNPDKIKLRGIFGAPDIIIEIASPSNAIRDRNYKKDLYERHGVNEYWIVDPLSRAIEQYFLKDGAYELKGYYHWPTDDFLAYAKEDEMRSYTKQFACASFEGLEIDLEEVFTGMI